MGVRRGYRVVWPAVLDDFDDLLYFVRRHLNARVRFSKVNIEVLDEFALRFNRETSRVICTGVGASC